MAMRLLPASLRRLHPVTLAVFILLAVVFLWANLRVTSLVAEMHLDPVAAAPQELGPVGRFLFFRGWPLSPSHVCVWHGGRFHPEEDPVFAVLVIDFLLATFGSTGLAVLSQWAVRKTRAARAKTG
jgi:hypothetical protein